MTGRGYRVQTAHDGEAALEQVRRHPPDLAVLGVRLPRRSGFQIVETLRADDALERLPIILIAGNGSNESRIQGLRLGADDYLVKPFSPRELILKIRTILDRSGDLKLLRRQHETLKEEARQQRAMMGRAREEMDGYLGRISAVLADLEEIGSSADAEAVARGVVETCGREIEFTPAALFVRSKSSSRLRARAWNGSPADAIRRVRFSSEDLLCRCLLMEGRTMTAEEFAGYPLAADDLRRLAALGFTHLTPISGDGELLAVIAGGERPDGSRLGPFDLHLLGLLARSAGLALQDAERGAQARRAFVDTAAHLIATVEGRYDQMRGHSARVQDIAIRLAEALNLTRRERETVAYAALLHDLGTLQEDEELLASPRRLSDDERAALRRRSSAGVQRLLAGSELPDVAAAVAHVHEAWDGRGVPEGLAGEAIPLAARIVSLANAYDALIHPRPHRAAYERQEALAILGAGSGSRYEPRLVALLGELLADGEDEVQSLMMPTMRGAEDGSK